jgi:biopolymer transport protein ExbD/biopolymer transport protein TolR
MPHFTKGQKGVIAEINITPLTDVFLVLLIIIMVVAPVMARVNRNIRLPELTEGDSLQQHLLTVEVAADGASFVEGRPIAEDQLSQWLADRAALAPGKTLVVRGDGTTRSHNVLRLIEAARVAGFERVLIAGRTRGPATTTDAAVSLRDKERAIP